MLSLPWKRRASVRPPFDCMNSRRARSLAAQPAGDLVDVAAQDRATGRRRPPWCRRAPTSFISGLISCDTETWVKPDVPGEGGDRVLMRGVTVAVHEHDGGRRGCRRRRPPRAARSRRRPGRPAGTARRARRCARRPRSTRSYSSSGSRMRRSKDPRPVLVADAQRVAEAPGDHQQRALALALEQRVGGHRRAHLDGLDRVRRELSAPAAGRGARGCRGSRRPGSVPGFSDSSLWVTRRPSGRRATMSVKVPPRSIQNCHLPSTSVNTTPGSMYDMSKGLAMSAVRGNKYDGPRVIWPW